ncbi:thioredoxin family protein [Paenibacillus sp. YN15]|uniref:thioredoxin family protein n=1 Tax=Paenibacillus sp. YN15 TaxID=1742774 RepID=UPI002852E649|nr:thioredoxin family protein [Paenibacillus sp. YN15]
MMIYLGIILGVFVILFFVNKASLKAQDDNVYGVPASQLDSMTVKQLDNPNYQNIILPADLTQKLSDKASMFVYFFSPTCVHCVATTPHLVPLTKELGVDMKMYNLLEFKEGWTDYKLQYTPTLIYYKDGQEADRIEGGFSMEKNKPTAESYEKFKAFLNKYKSP